MIIQYTGYEPGPNCRNYNFQVRYTAAKVRDFILSVKNQALVDCKFKDQDIPDLCYGKMTRDLAAETEAQPLALSVAISDLELKAYASAHYPAKRKLYKS